MDISEQTNPHKLQKRLNELLQARKHLVTNITSSQKRKRLIVETLQSKEKQPKLIKQQNSITIKSQESISEHHTHLNTEEEEIRKVIDAQSAIKERNRRMLGGLNGYLKKAESRLRQDEGKIKEKMEIEEKNIQREKEQMTQLQVDKLRQLETQIQELNGKKDQNSAQMLQIQNALLKHKFVTYVSDLSQHLLTTTQPVIAWKPHQPTPALASLAQKQLQKRKEGEQKVVEAIEGYQEKFDFRKYTLQNQRQYYNHLLDSYLTSKTNFICTNTTPSILWLPAAEGYSKCSALLNETKASILKEGQKIKELNEQHYLQRKEVDHDHQQLDEGQESQSGH